MSKATTNLLGVALLSLTLGLAACSSNDDDDGHGGKYRQYRWHEPRRWHRRHDAGRQWGTIH